MRDLNDLKRSIEDVLPNLSTRAKNVLQKENIFHLVFLLTQNPDDTRAWPYAGPKTIENIKSELQKIGWTFGELSNYEPLCNQIIAAHWEHLEPVPHADTLVIKAQYYGETITDQGYQNSIEASKRKFITSKFPELRHVPTRFFERELTRGQKKEWLNNHDFSPLMTAIDNSIPALQQYYGMIEEEVTTNPARTREEFAAALATQIANSPKLQALEGILGPDFLLATIANTDNEIVDAAIEAAVAAVQRKLDTI